MRLNRHQIRELAFKTLFAMNSNDTISKNDFLKDITNDKLQTIPDYLNQLIDGVKAHQSEIDHDISQYLNSGWTIARIARTDLIILRIAFYENNYVDSIPSKVAINEALELSKKYSDDKSKNFVNGVLSNIINN
ncbi:N utilization substance protein B [Philodulcilactobacillus myokoensis]|uniref:Transcription antitermination protein NusB n=1 Tax=Philodulcilactobacillus myokoensis TaxID=2929573 RepID=A0A9W6B283_9LACO|nr:transcription antitermination factor NusB [Philodulcilactobacillus myokoensis]GLB46799.1 N utilization substance protein B [Philodulcilactobacillus myokoensis]